MSLITESPNPRVRDSVRGVLVAPATTKLYWILRVGVAAEFIEHGLAGLARGPWLSYYALFGIPPGFAWNYMFYVTAPVDLTVGLLTLFFPIRLVLLYTAQHAMTCHAGRRHTS